MKKLFVVLAAMVMTLSASAFDFDGINLNASVNKISSAIAKRGYVYDDKSDAFTGLCRGTQIYMSMNWKDVKEVVLAVAKGFNAEGAMDLEIVLPEALKKDLEGFVAGELTKVLKGGIEASFSKKIAGGFTIGPKDGGYFISFTDETFNALISEYLRPATKKILFG